MPSLPRMPRVQPFRTTAKGLVGCWPCFEGVGPTVHDISGRANDGTVVVNGGFPAWDTASRPPGPYQEAMSFNGGSGYVGTAQNSPVQTSCVSVCAWVNYALLARGDAVTVAHNLGSPADQFDLLVISGAPYFFISNGSAAANSGAGPALSAETWYHLCGRYDGAAISVWVNGVLGAEAASSFVLGTGIGQPVQFGNNSGGDGAMTGSIGDVRLYDRALAPSEIWDIYTGNG